MRPTHLFTACTAGLAVAGIVGVGAAAGAQADAGGSRSTREVGGFLARQLDAYDGVLPYPGTDQADPGLSIDAVLGMLATGVGPEQARRAVSAVAPELGTYLGPGIAPSELYAGPVAKTVLLATAMGGDPRAFAGRDLVADLAGLEGADGRYADRTAYGDTSNTYTQALGILATTRVAGEAPARPVGFLLDQQCADGGFRLYVTDDGCVSDPDPTALAVTALRDTGEHAAADRALGYLRARMGADGGIGGGTGASSPNSNTTGLSAMAFALSGEAWGDAARDAQNFLLSLQFGCDADESLRGAVAYDAAAYADVLASGRPVSDQERRSSAQAALGLAGVSLVGITIDGATAPSSACGGATSTPSSTSTSSGGSSTSAGASTSTVPTSGSVTRTVTATVTRSAAPQVISTAAATVTVTAPAPTVTRTVTATASHSTTDGSSPAGPLTSAATDAPTGQATAVAAVPIGDDGGGTGGGPLVIAGALVLLGAAGASAILRRGRTH